MGPQFRRPATILLLVSALVGCSTAQPVKRQAYARLAGEKTLEHPFPDVWKGIEKTLQDYKVVDRSPSEVDELELKRLTARSIETDWIYGQSRDKYTEYKVNGSPRKKLLQSRFRFKVDARNRIGGTDVKVALDEEVERLSADGTSAGYESAEPDSSRARELLDRIQNAVLSAAP